MPQPTLTIEPPTVAKIRALVAEHGEKPAGRLLGLSPLTIARILAGLPVSRGTLLQLNQTLVA